MNSFQDKRMYDPIARLIKEYNNQIVKKSIVTFLLEDPKKALKQLHGSHVKSFMRKVKHPEERENIPDDFLKHYLVMPRAMEIHGHTQLSFAEALTEINVRDGQIGTWINSGLSNLMMAAFEYEGLNRNRLARNLYERVFLACEIIMEGRVEDLMSGILNEVMAICKLMLDEGGVNKYFQKSCDSFSRYNTWMLERQQKRRKKQDHKKKPRLTEAELDEKARMVAGNIEKISGLSEDEKPSIERIKENIIRDSEREGIEIISLDDPILDVLYATEYLFNVKMHPKHTLKDYLGLDYGYLSLKRCEFFIENTEGM